MRESWNHSKLALLEHFLLVDWRPFNIYHIGPTFEPNDDDDQAFSEFEWLNLNSFVAKLFKLNSVSWYNFPIWEFQIGLESPISEEAAAANTRVRVACEWIIQCARRFFRESLLNTCSDEPEGGSHGYPFRGGPLYPGVSGYNLERWGLWKRRLGELRQESDEDVHGMIDEAIQAMVAVEKEVASSMSI